MSNELRYCVQINFVAKLSNKLCYCVQINSAEYIATEFIMSNELHYASPSVRLSKINVMCKQMSSGINLIQCETESSRQLTFPEFHFETEAKVDFPSACI